MYCTVYSSAYHVRNILYAITQYAFITVSFKEKLLGITYPTVVHEFLEKILHKGGSGTRNLLGIT